MALPFEELDAITNDYFMMENGKAVDIYFDDSWLLNYLLKQQGGIWKRPNGGEQIRVPLEYDAQVSGFFSKGDVLSSDDRESLNAALFDWKFAFGNATIYKIDTLKNAGEYAQVQLVVQRVANAQKSIRKTLAGSVYDAPGGASDRLTGLLALCNETSSLAYGEIAEDDLVSNDGTKPWEGKVNTTSETVSLPVLRTLKSDAKIRDGKGGKPDLMTTTEDLFNSVNDILQVQQRFTNSKRMADAGFTGIVFEGVEIFADDYCPSDYLFALNSNHVGFAVHAEGLFPRSGWRFIEGSPEDRTWKVYFFGNMVCNNRKAHKAHSNLSA